MITLDYSGGPNVIKGSLWEGRQKRRYDGSRNKSLFDKNCLINAKKINM